MTELDAGLFTIVCKCCSADLASGRSVVKIKHHHVVDDPSIRDRITLQEMPKDKQRSFMEEDYVSEFKFGIRWNCKKKKDIKKIYILFAYLKSLW